MRVTWAGRILVDVVAAVLGAAGLVVESGESVGDVAAEVEPASAQPYRDVGDRAVAGELYRVGQLDFLQEI